MFCEFRDYVCQSIQEALVLRDQTKTEGMNHRQQEREREKDKSSLAVRYKVPSDCLKT